jgi:hypothetical protein
MVNSRHYHITGLPDEDQQFEADGVITSTVDGTMIPEENDQSNFGDRKDFDEKQQSTYNRRHLNYFLQPVYPRLFV